MAEWTQLLTALAQTGAVGILAAVLLFLHRESLRTFTTELRQERTDNVNQQNAERATNQQTWKMYLEMTLAHHEAAMSQARQNHETTMKALAEQDKALALILRGKP